MSTVANGFAGMGVMVMEGAEFLIRAEEFLTTPMELG